MVFLTSTSRLIREHPASEIEATSKIPEFHIYAHTTVDPVTPHISGANANHPALKRAQNASTAIQQNGAIHTDLEREMQQAANQLGVRFVLHVNAAHGIDVDAKHAKVQRVLDPSYLTATPHKPALNLNGRSIPTAEQLQSVLGVPRKVKHLDSDVARESEDAMQRAGIWNAPLEPPRVFTHYKEITPQPNDPQPISNFQHLPKFLSAHDALIFQGIIEQQKAQREKQRLQRALDTAPKVPLRGGAKPVDATGPTSVMASLPPIAVRAVSFDPFDSDERQPGEVQTRRLPQLPDPILLPDPADHPELRVSDLPQLLPVARRARPPAPLVTQEPILLPDPADARATRIPSQVEIDELARGYNKDQFVESHEPNGTLGKHFLGRVSLIRTRDDALHILKRHAQVFLAGAPTDEEERDTFAADHYNQLLNAVELLREKITNEKDLHLILRNDKRGLTKAELARSTEAFDEFTVNPTEEQTDAMNIVLDGLNVLPLPYKDNFARHLIKETSGRPKFTKDKELELGIPVSELNDLKSGQKPGVDEFYGRPIRDLAGESKRLNSGAQSPLASQALGRTPSPLPVRFTKENLIEALREHGFTSYGTLITPDAAKKLRQTTLDDHYDEAIESMAALNQDLSPGAVRLLVSKSTADFTEPEKALYKSLGRKRGARDNVKSLLDKMPPAIRDAAITHLLEQVQSLQPRAPPGSTPAIPITQAQGSRSKPLLGGDMHPFPAPALPVNLTELTKKHVIDLMTHHGFQDGILKRYRPLQNDGADELYTQDANVHLSEANNAYRKALEAIRALTNDNPRLRGDDLIKFITSMKTQTQMAITDRVINYPSRSMSNADDARAITATMPVELREAVIQHLVQQVQNANSPPTRPTPTRPTGSRISPPPLPGNAPASVPRTQAMVSPLTRVVATELIAKHGFHDTMGHRTGNSQEARRYAPDAYAAALIAMRNIVAAKGMDRSRESVSQVLETTENDSIRNANESVNLLTDNRENVRVIVEALHNMPRPIAQQVVAHLVEEANKQLAPTGAGELISKKIALDLLAEHGFAFGSKHYLNRPEMESVGHKSYPNRKEFDEIAQQGLDSAIDRINEIIHLEGNLLNGYNLVNYLVKGEPAIAGVTNKAVIEKQKAIFTFVSNLPASERVQMIVYLVRAAQDKRLSV